jgi:hypothetical protein
VLARRYSLFAVLAALLFPAVAQAADTTPPSAPTGLTATPGNGSIALAWGASTDDVGVDGYNIYRSDSSFVGQAFTTSNTITGLANGTQRCSFVKAFDHAGNQSAQSGTACATPNPAPSTPTGLKVTAQGAGTVTLKWTASTGMQTGDVYRVFRNGSLLAGSVSATTYTATGLANDTAGTFTVAAGQTGRLSAQTAGVTGTPTTIPRSLLAHGTLAQSDPTEQARIVAEAGSLGLVLVQKWQGAFAQNLKAANPALKVVIYENMSRCSNGTNFPSLVAKATCVANGWATSSIDGDADGPIARVDLSAYRSQAAANAASDLAARSWADGVFLDDANPVPGEDVGQPSSGISDTDWRAGISSLLTQVTGAVSSGALVMPNLAGSWGECNAWYSSWCDTQLGNVNAGFDEFFGRWRDGSVSGYVSEDIQALENASTAGKVFWANVYPSGTAAATESSLAAFLMGNKSWAGTSYFGWSNDTDTFSQSLLTRARGLGLPTGTGARYVDAAGVWRRDFQHGYVRVNVGATTAGGLVGYTGEVVKTS